MRHVTLTAAVLMWVLAAPAAHAQSWEVSGFVGHTPSADLDRRAPELDELSIRDGFTWGAEAARLFTSRWAAEVSWSEQASALEIGTGAGTADLFTTRVRQLQCSRAQRIHAHQPPIQARASPAPAFV